jgi:Uma2 family endonuclease
MAITRRLTPEEFLKLPEEKPYLELIDGVVRRKVAPQEQHGSLQLDFGAMINGYARPRKLAWAFSELRGRFGDDVLLPDVAVYRWERLSRTETGELANVYLGPPDVAVEIVSPEQYVNEMIAKCRRYLAHGVQVTLVVDPRRRVVIPVDPTSSTTLRGQDRIDLDPVLPGSELTVQDLFATLRVD